MRDRLTTVADAGRGLRRGEITVTSMTEAYFGEIARIDGDVRAWVVLDEAAALKTAGLLDDELASGLDRGPLHGIPVTVKDVIDVTGLPTRAGSPLRNRMTAAAADAPVVAALRKAGAVVLGKSVTTQFAYDDPPPTRNPWNLERTPGGSSSGPAAALAAGMALIGIGTQTGGSLLRPAAYCGVAAIKPTWGRVSLDGVVPLAFDLDHVGLMATDCAGLAVALDAVCLDDDQYAFRSRVPAPRCLDALEGRGGPPTFGLLTGMFREADDKVRDVFDVSIERLRAGGAIVEPVPPPSVLSKVVRDNRILLETQAAFGHREQFPVHRADFAPLLAAMLDEGRRASLADLPEVFVTRQIFRTELGALMRKYDALLTPSSTTTAPLADTTGHSTFNSPFSFAGVPTATIPAELAVDGLPVGIQFIGAPWGEAPLLAVAQWAEQRVDFSHVSPMARSRAGERD